MKTTPFPYQRELIREVKNRDFYALFLEAGAGKTKIALDLMAHWQCDINLIIPPCSLVRTWQDEIAKHYDRPYVIYTVDDVKKGKVDIADFTADIFLIIGVESLGAGKAYDALTGLLSLARDCNYSCVVDESTTIKNYKAKRTKRVIKIGESADKRLILNGTPITQGYEDLYTQMQFLDNKILREKNFYSFRGRYCVMGGYESRKIIGYRDVDDLMLRIEPHASLLRKADIIDDLPPKLPPIRRYVQLAPEQRRLYRQIENQELSGLDGERIDLSYVIQVYLRLHQVVGGHVPADDSGEVREITAPKIAETLVVIEQHPTDQIVIFCRFVAEAKRLQRDIVQSLDRTVVTYTGGDTADEVEKFTSGEADILITTYSKGAKGLNLQCAAVAILYSFHFSYELYSQARDRVHRVATTVSPTYYEIVCEDSIDTKNLLPAIEKKKSLAKHLENIL